MSENESKRRYKVTLKDATACEKNVIIQHEKSCNEKEIYKTKIDYNSFMLI